MGTSGRKINQQEMGRFISQRWWLEQFGVPILFPFGPTTNNRNRREATPRMSKLRDSLIPLIKLHTYINKFFKLFTLVKFCDLKFRSCLQEND